MSCVGLSCTDAGPIDTAKSPGMHRAAHPSQPMRGLRPGQALQHSLEQGIQCRTGLLVQQQVVRLLQLLKLICRPRVVGVLVGVLY